MNYKDFRKTLQNTIIQDKRLNSYKHHSTSHAINYSVNLILDRIQSQKHVLGIFIDLSKAFDTINHGQLLEKLCRYGIRGNCLELLKDYLTSRNKLVKFVKFVLHRSALGCMSLLPFTIYKSLGSSLSESCTVLVYQARFKRFCSANACRTID